MKAPGCQGIRLPSPFYPLCVAVLAALATACGSPDRQSASRAAYHAAETGDPLPGRLGSEWTIASRGPRPRPVAVDPGHPNEAGPYYAQLESDLGAPFTTFNRVLQYFGYNGLRGDDVENLEPAVLMDPVALAAAVQREEFQNAVKAVPLAPDDILCVRFFAPGITDVAGTPLAIRLGWRKVVRLRARAGSRAQTKGLASAWLLFNVFSNGIRPFDTKSANNQVMLIRADGVTSLKPAYWLVFEGVHNPAGDGRRIESLNASFDSRHPDVAHGNAYYVPRACAGCHGGLSGGQPAYDTARLNYLDTDHWFDRTRDDFRTIDPSLGVIVDGGNDTNSEQFKKAFAVVYRLNSEIKAQNTATNGPGGDQFQLRAVSRWLQVHENNIQFVDPFQRNIAAPTEPQWSRANQVDAQVLPLLNRYCSRCHSSLRYHVFDKPAVIEKKTGMVERLQKAVTDPLSMPQDRDLEGLGELTRRDRACLIQLLPLVGTPQSSVCPPR